ncbi:MAG: glycosyl transferase family 1 [Planctomycetota bacterium]|nr:MAG: glycosyl transferase family 1 [Planctomycetota bacterium]
MLDGLPSGAQTRLAALGAELHAQPDVDLLHMVRPGVAPLPDLPCVEVPGLDTPWRRARAGTRLDALALEHGAEVLALGALPLPRVNAVPVALTVHDLRFLGATPGVSLARRMWGRTRLAGNLRRAQALVAVSQSTADDLRARLRGSAPELHVVPNARTPGLERVKDTQVLADFRRRIGLNARFALMVGPVESHKGVGLALDLLTTLRAHPDASDVGLLLAGRVSPMAAREVARRAQRAGLEQSVRLCGTLGLDDLCLAYSAADALLALGRHEGFCLPAVDAQALGVPVVGLRAGALPEVLGEASWLEDTTDLPVLASALLDALTPGDFREARLQQARRRALSWSWASSAERLRDCWARLLTPS